MIRLSGIGGSCAKTTYKSRCVPKAQNRFNQVGVCGCCLFVVVSFGFHLCLPLLRAHFSGRSVGVHARRSRKKNKQKSNTQIMITSNNEWKQKVRLNSISLFTATGSSSTIWSMVAELAWTQLNWISLNHFHFLFILIGEMHANRYARTHLPHQNNPITGSWNQNSLTEFICRICGVA